ncbi:TonB-dependent receptor [Mesorhizobium sp. Root552]|uniref:TonB-dependent receptor plug domain-containing protein n=1 Tax=Mesorhizobium sp. Root552 TaxID=1736555 RepID=UPI0006FB1CFB|nr:TonB-dependent receptor [Mesorhizobium sp. Root552]KQZ29522.1 TonB-dependent receptor [Mesorhizobium sp. Root552]
MKKTLFAASACALALTGGAFAQQAESEAATKLDRIVITTPLRRASSLERSTSSVAVIETKDIEKSPAVDLPALLKTYAGVTVTSNGGLGADSSVSLRGTSANQTLVLVNGVRASSATSGTFNLSSIPLSSIERIEIAKGGHSAQYGADAIGGIINIITRQGGGCENGSSTCGSLTAGIMHPWGGTLSGDIRGETGNGGSYAFGASLLGTRGYDFTLPTTYGHEPDDDGFVRGTANFSLSKDLGWGTIYTDGIFARGRNQYDRAAANEADTTNFSGRLGARLKHSDTWESTVELTAALDSSSNFRGATDGDDFDTSRYGMLASTQKTFETDTASHIFQLGAEAYRDSVDGSSVSGVDYSKKQRDLQAVFGQYSLEYDRLTLDSGVRYDHDGQFGSQTTYNLGASYELLDGLVARASYATGFRAPTFNDLYYPDPWTPGNPNLRPERSRSYEVGVNWQAGEDTSLDAALYQIKVEDQINWAETFPGSFIWQPSNVENVTITGFEATLQHRFSDEWSGKASVDIREPLNESPGTHGKYVAYGERFRGTAGLTYTPNEKLSLTGALLYVTSRFANGGNTVKLPAYVTADFSAQYAFDEQSQLKFSAQNIFDEKYETKAGFRSPGRTLSLTFTRSF